MEEALEGGHTTPGVVKSGDSVRRPRGRRSVFAAKVLRELNARGYRWAPRYLGIDDQGRDVLSFVEGATTSHPSERDERSYAAVGRMLRELHELTRGSELAAGGECVVHGDPGPFNVVMRRGMPVALIDWDAAHAGDPLTDVGYAGWTWCIQAVGGVPVADQARRLSELVGGYGAALPPDTVLAAIERAQLHIVQVEQGNADDPGLSDTRRAHARAAVDWATNDHRVLEVNRNLFRQAL
ncbi:aminoglycoside phosphotransferase family protein [Humibacter sp.]|uniref:aminoglycoside phosphotransferase family protein n=1 Tax=Humibacter sp. TaxID=1940291 RepID=UPI003F7F8248